jgi:nucleoside 2-deoxyribosyltransferase
MLDCYARNPQEYLFFLELLRDKELIAVKISRTTDGGGVLSPIAITPSGWQRLEYLEAGANSGQVFVAMSFAHEMDPAYLAIEKACKSLGFMARRIDTKEHNNEIVGEILYEIARSRFVVADVTGQRQGVYFEAGFAMGIRRSVIWTCKKENFAEVHFDASHFNHIVWSNEEELGDRLTKRIKGTILLPT